MSTRMHEETVLHKDVFYEVCSILYTVAAVHVVAAVVVAVVLRMHGLKLLPRLQAATMPYNTC